ncbi:hypothetical protein B484DRAFT_406048 [Ochromonadaceae sp. CCMP2298]|nr:hypothetical protein B484DRAFT_406048 [Ochromonadaceae sp. CCMP2298]
MEKKEYAADAPEPLTRLLAPVDDQSNLSLFCYKGRSADDHEDRGLLTIVYDPGSDSTMDRHGVCVSLAADEVAVWSGCALQAATAVPSYEKAVIQAAPHSIKPLLTMRYSLLFRLRGCGAALLDPTRFLSPQVLRIDFRQWLLAYRKKWAAFWNYLSDESMDEIVAQVSQTPL